MSSSERATELATHIENRTLSAVIVLVEDDEESRRVYGLILRHYGYRVEDARNGKQAIELMRARLPDLVLMDIGLPIMDGWQASTIAKSDPELSRIPLIAFSGRVDCVADLRARMTFDGYILKPVSPAELVRRIDAYLTLARRAPRPRIAQTRGDAEATL